MRAEVITGDCLETMRTMEADSVDSVVTDPPYGLAKPPPIEEVLSCWLDGRPWVATGKGFMGKEWDSSVPGPEYWRECYRVLKPGGHMCVFAGSRTVDLMGTALRLAGFEIRDSLQWLYGGGFPKSMNVSKAIDRAAGALKPESTASVYAGEYGGRNLKSPSTKDYVPPAPATGAAKQWQGWGTALKPAHEPILLVRKPFKGTVAKNVQKHGTGGLNIDGCRIGTSGATSKAAALAGIPKEDSVNAYGKGLNGGGGKGREIEAGRWPANVIMDEEAGAILDAQTSGKRCARSSSGGGRSTGERGGSGGIWGGVPVGHDGSAGQYYDSGGASRFFYCAKTSKKERNAGLEAGANVHPTVKPQSLMRWLCRLITPTGGVVLDPFNGSGSTGCAAVQEGFRYIGCELNEEYSEIARARIEHWGKI